MRGRKSASGSRRPAKNPHREWLALVEVYGPFLSPEVLQQEFPQGLDSQDRELTRRLRSAYEEWQDQRLDPAYHREWLNFLLQEVLEFPPEVWKQGAEIPPGCQVHLPQHGEALKPDWVLLDGDRIRWLVQWLPAGQKLDKPLPGKAWVADPIWRMVELLHGTGHCLGLVSNGEHFAVVSAPLGEPSGVASFYAEMWLEEPLTLQAFRTLFGVRRFLSVLFESGPEALLKRSAEEQHQVTTALGKQVLSAVELLVSELDRLDRGQQGQLLQGIDERSLFRAALTVMMRLIFLLSAEERELLPLNNPLYQESYAVSPLAQMLRAVPDEEILSRREDAWVRLLATFRAVYAGVQHEDLHLPAYAGSLFDPDLFPFLEGRPAGTSWATTPASPLPLHNRLVLYLLESLQTLKEKGKDEVLQRVSFRALDVEQLGHVYESLLDHTVKRSPSAVLGLRGQAGREPEIPLYLLQEGPDNALVALASATGRKPGDLQREIVYDTPPENPMLRDSCEDERLYYQVLPYQKLLRENAMGHKVVFPPGGAYVTQGSERKESGAHYTPRSLTEEMVQHTLDPLVYIGMRKGQEPGPERLLRPEQLLALKVLDMAMGSGAFLVQSCRYLAERLVESWACHGGPADLPMEPEARLAVARRQIAESCLFGVDRDPLAVEMAKLSLWLLTLDRQKPFSFLDHALRCGDSLLGLTSLAQLRQLTLQPSTVPVTIKLSEEQVDGAMRRAREARIRLESFVVVDPRDAEQKAALLREAEQASAELRGLGDLLVAAGLQTAGAKGFDDRVAEMVAVPERPTSRWLNDGKPESAPDRQPFHWVLEFPEVFEAGGFDAVVGNPPFLGGKRLTGPLGEDYREYLIHYLAHGQRGSADLVAYFFLRARELLTKAGALGLVATNTLAQGDTREVGLDRLVDKGLCIYQACPGRRWPGGAALEIAQIWATPGTWEAEVRLGGQVVSGITPSLTARSRVIGKPYRLAQNANRSFTGSVLELGFVLSFEDAQRLLEKDARNADVLFPYLNGEDLTSRPDQTASRWAINFHDWPLERVQQYPDCFKILIEKVKPDRETNTRAQRGDPWWWFARRRPELYRRLKGLERAIAAPSVSKYNVFTWQPTSVVFSHMLAIITSSEAGMMGLLQSTVHEDWARLHGSTLETRMRYTPSDCFETFPLPQNLQPIEGVSQVHCNLLENACLSRSEGLTKLLNRVNNVQEASQDVIEIRNCIRDQDHSVLYAYGWTDLDLGHGFYETSQGLRFTIHPSVRVELLDRLLELNHARYEEEVHQGLHQQKAVRAKSKPTVQESQLPLFAEELSPDPGTRPAAELSIVPETITTEERWEEIRQLRESMKKPGVSPITAPPAAAGRHHYKAPGYAEAASAPVDLDRLKAVDEAVLQEQKKRHLEQQRGQLEEAQGQSPLA